MENTTGTINSQALDHAVNNIREWLNDLESDEPDEPNYRRAEVYGITDTFQPFTTAEQHNETFMLTVAEILRDAAAAGVLGGDLDSLAEDVIIACTADEWQDVMIILARPARSGAYASSLRYDWGDLVDDPDLRGVDAVLAAARSVLDIAATLAGYTIRPTELVKHYAHIQ